MAGEPLRKNYVEAWFRCYLAGVDNGSHVAARQVAQDALRALGRFRRGRGEEVSTQMGEANGSRATERRS